MQVQIKRVYEEPRKEDGKRILIDRLWPRGLTKEKAKIDIWLKDIAPSAQLRKWFSHDSEKWMEFKKRYFKGNTAKYGSFIQASGRIKKRKINAHIWGKRRRA